MTEALKTMLDDVTYVQYEDDGYKVQVVLRKEVEDVITAIKSTPGLLWPEGEKWMRDGVVDAYVEREYPRSPIAKALAYEIRDRAQVAIDAKDAEYGNKIKHLQELLDHEVRLNSISESENTRLRGGLETMSKMHTENEWAELNTITHLRSELDKMNALVQKQSIEIDALKTDRWAMKAELDKAKERVRELEEREQDARYDAMERDEKSDL